MNLASNVVLIFIQFHNLLDTLVVLIKTLVDSLYIVVAATLATLEDTFNAHFLRAVEDKHVHDDGDTGIEHRTLEVFSWKSID